MSKDEDYLRNAEECQRMATASKSVPERLSWLALTESWLRLLLGFRPTPHLDTFDAELKGRGTQQELSHLSH